MCLVAATRIRFAMLLEPCVGLLLREPGVRSYAPREGLLVLGQLGCLASWAEESHDENDGRDGGGGGGGGDGMIVAQVSNSKLISVSE